MINIDFTQLDLKKIITHHVGNKLRDEGLSLSNEFTEIEDGTDSFLLKYFISNYRNEEYYNFFHTVSLEMNNVYEIIKGIFESPELFKESSKNLAKLLYENSLHPKIKEGQLNIVYFDNIFFNGHAINAIGIFKSETPLPFLQMEKRRSNYLIEHKYGFDLKSIDRGCIIYNTKPEDGYILSIMSTSNKGNEAQYWMDDFLKIRTLNNAFHQTNEFLGITKEFIVNQLSDEIELSKTDKIVFLNRSVNYFKENTTFDKNDFEEKVFEDAGIIDSFRSYENNFKEENEVVFEDNFEISSQAVKKQARKFKSVLKLDKNFHIYIHGDRDLIEQGIDEKGRKFYKIYYEEEN